MINNETHNSNQQKPNNNNGNPILNSLSNNNDIKNNAHNKDEEIDDSDNLKFKGFLPNNTDPFILQRFDSTNSPIAAQYKFSIDMPNVSQQRLHEYLNNDLLNALDVSPSISKINSGIPENMQNLNDLGDKQDEMLIGNVELEDTDNYFIDLGRTNGILPKKDCIPGEKIEMGSQIKVYVSKVDNNGKNLLILLSRSHYGFVKRLFELEIPEINDGTVMIYSVARDAGNRSKVAVYSENPNVDPIGACIGEKGSRIARIINELHGEKLDVIKYDADPAVFIENALSPAKDLTVAITDPKKLEAMVIADGDNFSLAIGKKGQNARLATRLTKFKKIDIKTTEQAREAGINFR